MTLTRIELQNEFRSKAKRWCQQTFGPGKLRNQKWSDMPWHSRVKDHGKIVTFYFQDESHAALFALRWKQ
jgi:hypothetical protein